MSTQHSDLYSTQFYIPVSKHEEITMILHDRFGEPEQYEYEMCGFTKGRASFRYYRTKREDEEEYGITSFSEYKATLSFPDIFHQVIEPSIVIGKLPSFLLSIGESSTYTWIEEGLKYTKDKVSIRVFSIVTKDERLDPQNYAVSIESAVTNGENINNVCKIITDYQKVYFPGVIIYKPQVF